MSTPDFPDWQAPQAHANAIAGTGAPLLALPTSVAATGSYPLAGGATTTTPGVAMSQIAYEVLATVSFATAPVTPFVSFTANWFDTTGTILLDSQSWILAGGTGTIYSTTITGPAEGALLQIVLANLDNVVTATVSLTVLTTSRPRSRHRGLGAHNATPAGYTLAGQQSPYNVLCAISNKTIAAASQLVRLLPLYAGDVFISINVSGAGNDNAKCSLTPAIPVGVPTVQCWWGTSGGAITNLAQGIIRLPRAPCQLEIDNTATTVATANISVVALDESE